MAIRERVEDVTGEPPSWWVLELYKVAFLFAGGIYIGWKAGAMETARRGRTVFGETVAVAPPDWLVWFLVPGILYLLWVVLPMPGFGSGGLSM